MEKGVIMDRNTARAGIFKTQKKKRKIVKFNGIDLEVIQPTVGEALDMNEETSTKEGIAQSMIKFCVIPGTNERIFEASDKDQILAMPFSEDFTDIQEAFTIMAAGDSAKEAEKN